MATYSNDTLSIDRRDGTASGSVDIMDGTTTIATLTVPADTTVAHDGNSHAVATDGTVTLSMKWATGDSGTATASAAGVWASTPFTVAGISVALSHGGERHDQEAAGNG